MPECFCRMVKYSNDFSQRFRHRSFCCLIERNRVVDVFVDVVDDNEHNSSPAPAPLIVANPIVAVLLLFPPDFVN